MFSLKLNKRAFKWSRKFRCAPAAFWVKLCKVFWFPSACFFCFGDKNCVIYIYLQVPMPCILHLHSAERKAHHVLSEVFSHMTLLVVFNFCLCIRQKQALEVYFDIEISDVFNFISLQTSKLLVVFWAVLLYNNAVVQQLFILARYPSISIFRIICMVYHTRLINN